MAINQIETGYKPEFGLGAMWAGENAANAEMANQLDFIKQFLANQREQQMQPIDVSQAQQNLTAGQYKTTPEYQTGMRDTISGQGMSNLAAGQTAAGLQPFKQKAEIAQSKEAFNLSDLTNQIYQLDQQISTEPNPLTRMAMSKERDRVAKALMSNPAFLGKQLLQRENNEADLEKARIMAEARKITPKNSWAEFGKQSPEKRLATAQAAIVSNKNPWTQEPLTEEEKMIFSQYYVQDRNTVNAANQAKVGGKVDISGVTKGEVPTYPIPDVGSSTSSKPSRQSDADLINKYLPK